MSLKETGDDNLSKFLEDDLLEQFTKSFLDDLYFLTMEEYDFTHLCEHYKVIAPVFVDIHDVLRRLGFKNKIAEQAFWDFAQDKRFGVFEWLKIRVRKNIKKTENAKKPEDNKKPENIKEDDSKLNSTEGEFTFTYFNEAGYKKLQQKQMVQGLIPNADVKFESSPITWSEASLLLEKNHKNFVYGRKFFVNVFLHDATSVISEDKFIELLTKLMKKKGIIDMTEGYRDGVKKLLYPYTKNRMKEFCSDELYHNEEEHRWYLKDDDGHKLIKRIDEIQKKREQLINRIVVHQEQIRYQKEEFAKQKKQRRFIMLQNMKSEVSSTKSAEITGMSSVNSFSVVDELSVMSMDDLESDDANESLTEPENRETGETDYDDSSDVQQPENDTRKLDYESESDESDTDNRICHRDDDDGEYFQGSDEELENEYNGSEDYSEQVEQMNNLVEKEGCQDSDDDASDEKSSENDKIQQSCPDAKQIKYDSGIPDYNLFDEYPANDEENGEDDNPQEVESSEEEGSEDTSNDHSLTENHEEEENSVDDESDDYLTDYSDEDSVNDEDYDYGFAPNDDGYEATQEDDENEDYSSFNEEKQNIQSEFSAFSTDDSSITTNVFSQQQQTKKKEEINPMDDILSLYGKSESKDEEKQTENKQEIDVLPIQLEKLIIVTEADRKKELEALQIRKDFKNAVLPPGIKKLTDFNDEMMATTKPDTDIEYLFGCKVKELPKEEKLKHVELLQRLAGTDKNSKSSTIFKSGGSGGSKNVNNVQTKQATAVVAAYQPTTTDEFYANNRSSSVSPNDMPQKQMKGVPPPDVTKPIPIRRLPVAGPSQLGSLTVDVPTRSGRPRPTITRVFPSPTKAEIERERQDRVNLVRIEQPNNNQMNTQRLPENVPNERLHQGPNKVPVGYQLPRTSRPIDNSQYSVVNRHPVEQQTDEYNMADQRQGYQSYTRNNNWQPIEESRYTPATEDNCDYRTVHPDPPNQHRTGRQNQSIDFAYHQQNPPPQLPPPGPPVYYDYYQPPPPPGQPSFSSNQSRFSTPTLSTPMPTRQILSPERIYDAMFKTLDACYAANPIGRVPLQSVRNHLQLADLPSDPGYVKNGYFHGWEEFCTHYTVYQFDVDNEVFFRG